MSKKLIYFLSAIALIVVLSACGSNNSKGSSSPSPSGSAPVASGAAEELVIQATNWEFTEKEYTIAKDTPVTLTLENLKGAHGIEIVGTDYKIVGNKSEVITLPAGTYEIKCSVMCGTGHSKMVTKLVVA